MGLTKFERLTLANQYRMLQTLRPEDGQHYRDLAYALEHGFALDYEDAFEALDKELSLDDCEFVSNTLDMFLNLQAAVEQGLLIASPKLVYQGFSSKQEYGYYAYAEFLLRKEGRWIAIRNSKRDAVMPKADAYRHLLSQYRLLPDTEMNKQGFLRFREAIEQ